MVTSVPVVWLCGPSGAGKSSVGYEIFRQLVVAGIKSAYLDFDQIRLCRPEPVDDPDNLGMSARNLAVIWPNFRADGVRCLITSGIVYTHEQIRAYADAVPDTRLTVCRLRASHDVLRARILLRGAGGGPALPGDRLRGLATEQLMQAADRSIGEADEMDRNRLGDLCIDTDSLTITEVAQLVRARTDLWP